MCTLLIVDDENIEREAIQYFIKQAGLEFELIEEAVNGVEAVNKALEIIPDIIIMDIKMPGKNGLEAAKEIRQFNTQCKIIFLTAFNEFEYAQKAIKVKAEDFILKPVYQDTLIEVLAGLLDYFKNSPTITMSLSLSGSENDKQLKNCGTLNNATILLLEQICNYIDENFSKNIKLDEICDMVGFSKFYLSRIFKHYKKMNLLDYIRFKRIEKTKEFLGDSRISIKEISGLVGYSDANYFTSVFKKVEGISPTEYRNKYCVIKPLVKE